MTFCRGHLVARDGLPQGDPGWGRWLPGAGTAGSSFVGNYITSTGNQVEQEKTP
jgi:hypothetical protein